MMIAVCFYATSLLLIKLINAWEPGLDSSVLLSVRSAAVCVLLSGVTTFGSGVAGWREKFVAPLELFQKRTYTISILGTVYEIFICVVCVGALPIVNVSIFINMSPVFAVLLAIWVIGEKLTAFNAVQVAASFVGVVLIIMGRDTASG